MISSRFIERYGELKRQEPDLWLPKTSSALHDLRFEDPASSPRNTGERLCRLRPHPVRPQSDLSCGHFLHL